MSTNRNRSSSTNSDKKTTPREAESPDTSNSPIGSGGSPSQVSFAANPRFVVSEASFGNPEPIPRRSSRLVTPRSVQGFRYKQHIVHMLGAGTPTTNTTTPRPGVTNDFDFDGVPEGLLATEGQQLSASFSLAPSRANDKTPIITGIDICMLPSTSPDTATSAIVIGDALGRVEHLLAKDGVFVRKHSHQAFVAEFDCLRSQHIEEKVKCVQVLPPRSPNVTSYLAANEKSIKLFRLRTDGPPPLASVGLSPSSGSVTPRFHKKVVMPTRAYTGPHQFPIQGLSLCADRETFLSVDDFQVYWWHIEAADTTKAALICDIKPPSMDDINELLTAAAFHPKHGSLFLAATSSGTCNVGDLRHPPCRSTRQFSATIKTLERHSVITSEHSDILTSIADAKFLGDDFVVTRDYLSLKLWDMRKTTDPVAMCPVMEYAAPHLDALYESDAIFDRFPIAADTQSFSVLTGLYGGKVALWCPRVDVAHVEYYEADAMVPPSEATNGGRVDEADMVHIASSADGISPEDQGNKVLYVSLAPGGKMFSYSTHEHLFVFEAQAGAHSPPPHLRVAS